MKTWERSWTRIRDLRTGGQGTTRLVKNNQSGETAVLKEVKNKTSGQARARLIREVSNQDAMARVSKQVPRVIESNASTASDDESIYLIMEHISGPTLAEFIEASPKGDFAKAAAITLSLCQTIAVAHSQEPGGILHRDIKPDNLIVRNKEINDIVVLDFGISFHSENNTLTLVDERIRNNFLISPEMGSSGGEKRDKRTDVAAVAGILYFCLTGQFPEQPRDHHNKPPHQRTNSVFQSFRDQPWFAAIDRLLERAFQQMFENRFQSIEDLANQIHAVISNPSGQLSAIDTLAELSSKIRKVDSVSRLEKMKNDAEVLKVIFLNHCGKWNHKLGIFKNQLNTVSEMPQSAMPKGVSIPRLDHQVVIYIMAAGHKESYFVGYFPAEVELRSMVYAIEFESRGGVVEPPSKWRFREVCRYEDDVKSVENIITQDMDRWLAEAAKSITSIIELRNRQA